MFVFVGGREEADGGAGRCVGVFGDGVTSCVCVCRRREGS